MQRTQKRSIKCRSFRLRGRERGGTQFKESETKSDRESEREDRKQTDRYTKRDRHRHTKRVKHGQTKGRQTNKQRDTDRPTEGHIQTRDTDRPTEGYR